MLKVFLILANLIISSGAALSDQGLSDELEGQCHEDGSGQCGQEVLRDGDAFIQAQVRAKKISGKAAIAEEKAKAAEANADKQVKAAQAESATTEDNAEEFADLSIEDLRRMAIEKKGMLYKEVKALSADQLRSELQSQVDLTMNTTKLAAMPGPGPYGTYGNLEREGPEECPEEGQWLRHGGWNRWSCVECNGGDVRRRRADSCDKCPPAPSPCSTQTGCLDCYTMPRDAWGNCYMRRDSQGGVFHYHNKGDKCVQCTRDDHCARFRGEVCDTVNGMCCQAGQVCPPPAARPEPGTPAPGAIPEDDWIHGFPWAHHSR